MNVFDRLNEIPIDEVKSIIAECSSKKEFMERFLIPRNGQTHRLTSRFLWRHNLEIKRGKYKYIEVECPVCAKKFQTTNNPKRRQKTCSYACSNTYFRSGENHGNWSGNNYRKICFSAHGKKCLICGEKKIVAVHHMNEDSTDHRPENLVPLCPTHHQYYHSRYRQEIEPMILEYLSGFSAVW